MAWFCAQKFNHIDCTFSITRRVEKKIHTFIFISGFFCFVFIMAFLNGWFTDPKSPPKTMLPMSMHFCQPWKHVSHIPSDLEVTWHDLDERGIQASCDFCTIRGIKLPWWHVQRCKMTGVHVDGIVNGWPHIYIKCSGIPVWKQTNMYSAVMLWFGQFST